MNEIEKAIKIRDDFLEKKPHLKKYQKEIDEVLSRCYNPQKKLETLTLMLTGKLIEMQLALKELIDINRK